MFLDGKAAFDFAQQAHIQIKNVTSIHIITHIKILLINKSLYISIGAQL